MRDKRAWWGAALAPILAASIGCGDAEPVEVTGELVTQAERDAAEDAAAAAASANAATLDDVRQVALAYAKFWAEHGGGLGPGSADELAPHLTGSSRALELIRRGELVVQWDASMRDLPGDGDKTVLVYGRHVPTRGGPVGFADASARMVDAAEFARLPRASFSL